MQSDWFFLVLVSCHLLTLQSADKDQQEMRAVAEKPHDAVVKFDTYRNVQRHRAVLPVIARLLLGFSVQRRPETKFQPRKNIPCTYVLSVTSFCVNYNKTHKSRTKYEIKYDLYKIGQK